MADGRVLPPKRAVALELLKELSVFVHLDPRRKGVVVPKHFASQHQLVLQLGMNMAVAIPDLEVGDNGISCTLSFNRRPFWCVLPWHAIYALVGEDGRSMVWPDDVPPEVAGQRQKPKLHVVSARTPKGESKEKEEGAQPIPLHPQPRPKLAMATSAAMKLPPDYDEAPPQEPARGSHLSVVGDTPASPPPAAPPEDDRVVPLRPRLSEVPALADAPEAPEEAVSAEAVSAEAGPVEAEPLDAEAKAAKAKADTRARARAKFVAADLEHMSADELAVALRELRAADGDRPDDGDDEKGVPDPDEPPSGGGGRPPWLRVVK